MIGFIVYGCPAPQGSKSFKGIHGGKAVMAESCKRLKPWRADVRAAAEQAVRDARAALDAQGKHWQAGTAFPLDGPLRVRLVFTMPKPKGAPKLRRSYPIRKPDGSKLQRAVEDAMTDAGLIRDDARIVEWSGAKRFPGEGSDALDAPGVRISVEVVG